MMSESSEHKLLPVSAPVLFKCIFKAQNKPRGFTTFQTLHFVLIMLTGPFPVDTINKSSLMHLGGGKIEKMADIKHTKVIIFSLIFFKSQVTQK